jgi:hypothetical protein
MGGLDFGEVLEPSFSNAAVRNDPERFFDRYPYRESSAGGFIREVRFRTDFSNTGTTFLTEKPCQHTTYFVRSSNSRNERKSVMI